MPFYRYSELLGELERRCSTSRPLTVLDHALDGSPLVVVKCGGSKLPAAFISAGAHSPEQAGVVAATQLVSELRTEHAVYILPCRDPVGLNGFAAALKLGLGAGAPEEMPSTVAAATALLREKGEIIYDEGGRLIALLGDHAYTIRQGTRTAMIVAGDPDLTSGPVHEALLGKRIWWPTLHTSDSVSTGEVGVVEGAEEMERAFTQFGTVDDILHINRFHDTPWAPVEVRCARNVMRETKPRLVIDLHEHNGSDFWMSARHQVHDQPGTRRQVPSGDDGRVLDVNAEDEDWEIAMARKVSEVVAAAGVPLHEPGRTGNGGGKSFFHDLGPGVMWLDAGQRGEGLNLADYGGQDPLPTSLLRVHHTADTTLLSRRGPIRYELHGRDWHVPAVCQPRVDGQARGADAP